MEEVKKVELYRLRIKTGQSITFFINLKKNVDINKLRERCYFQ